MTTAEHKWAINIANKVIAKEMIGVPKNVAILACLEYLDSVMEVTNGDSLAVSILIGRAIRDS